MALTPKERSDASRIGAHFLHAQYDSRALTAPARAGFDASFKRKVRLEAEGNGEILTEAEVTRRAGHLKKAHMLRMARVSAKARAKAGGDAA
jgi:hypothetical protein